MARREWGLGVALMLALASAARPAHACLPLEPGLRASARPLNLDAPVPVNGALVFEVDCWHDCTPCQAAEQRLDITVVDEAGHSLRGDKPEQVFLSEDAQRHLVLWRFASPPSPGSYQVSVGVRSQDEPASYPLTLVAPLAEPDASGTLAAATTTYDVARGSLYVCALNQDECNPSTLAFGSQVEALPALQLTPGSVADESARGQLLYQVMHHAADGSQHWGSWRLALQRPSELVRFAAAISEYCADIEMRSLLADGVVTAATPCVPHGSLQAPHIADTPIDGALTSCLMPPSGLEPEWCALHEPVCTDATSPACDAVAEYCTEPITRGSPGSADEGEDLTSVEPVEQCLSPADPYDESVAGCTCRMGKRPTPGAPLAWVLLGVPWWFRRARRTGTVLA